MVTTSVEIRGTRISGVVVRNCFPAIVWTAVGPAVRVAVLDVGLGVGVGGWRALRVVAVKAGGVWAKPVVVAGRVCSVENSVKAGDTRIPEVGLTVAALVTSVGGDSRLSGFDSVTIFSWCGLLWSLGSAV